jgi:hypothetical protein
MFSIEQFDKLDDVASLSPPGFSNLITSIFAREKHNLPNVVIESGILIDLIEQLEKHKLLICIN